MKIKKFFSVIFALLGIAVAAAAVFLALSFREAKPVLLSPPLLAKSQAVSLMNEICAGDFESASQRLLGTPDLGVDREAAEEVGVMIWEAYLESLSYDMVGTCYATDDGLAQNVVLTCLDVTSVTANLQQRAQALLEERVAAAENTTEIYDDNYEYREEFVMKVLRDAMEEALVEDAAEMTVELTLNMVYRDGQWWVVADSALLDAISGGVLY